MENHKSAEDEIFRPSGRFSGRGSFWIISVTALTVLLSGLWMARQSGQNADLQMRRDLVRQTTDIAAAIDPSAVRALSFTAEDRALPEFQRLCSQLRSYAATARLSSLYTMGCRDGRILFGPESLDESHPYASPPGTVYKTPSQKDFELFKTGSPQIQGPRSDEYGTFVTASAPVFDPRTGEVLAAVGIDVEASAWRAAVRRAQWIPAGITAVLLLMLLLNWLTLKHRHRHSPQRIGRKRHAEPVLCTLFMTVLTLVLAVSFHQAERQARRDTFYALAHSYAAACAQEFYEFHSKLNQLVYFFESSQEVTSGEFSTYCSNIIQQSTLQACTWIPAVPETGAGTFIQTVRAAGMPDFSIWQKNSEGRSEAVQSRPFYYPACYIEPQSGHEEARGYDMNSEPVRSAAIQEALRTGLSTATDPVRFFKLTDSPQGIFIFSPVNAAVQKGLVAFAIRPENLLGGAQYNYKKNLGLNICLFQLKSGAEPLIVTGSSDTCGLSCFDEAGSGLYLTVPVFRFGKTYALRLKPDSSWLAAHPLRHGWMAGVFGLLITGLISSMVALITNRRITLEKEVDHRTAELKASESCYRLLAENIQDVITVFSPDGKAAFASPSIETVLGYTPQEFCGTDMYELVCPEDRAGLEKAVAVLMETGYTVHEARFRARSGQYVWLATSVKLLRSGTGVPQELICSSRDISARKKTEAVLLEQERVLKESEIRYRTLADSGQALIWTSGLDRKCDYFNQPWLAFTGRTLEQELGDGWADGVHPDDVQRCIKIYNDAFDRRERFSMDYRLRHHDGEFRWIQDTGTPRYDSEGNFQGYIGHCLDITGRKRAEEELLQKYAELERFNKVTVDRELRMVGLKEEINALLKASGRPEKYRIVQGDV